MMRPKQFAASPDSFPGARFVQPLCRTFPEIRSKETALYLHKRVDITTAYPRFRFRSCNGSGY